MNRYQLNKDAEEVHRIMEKTDNREIYALAVILWHILCWIERRDK